VVVWDAVKRGKAKWLVANPSGDHVSDVAFTPDGTGLLTACIDGVGGVRRWQAGNWHRKPAFATRAHCDGALTVSPDGRTVATANNDGRTGAKVIKLWNYPKGTHRKTSAPAGSLVRLIYSSDGALLAGNDDRQRVRVWDARSLTQIAEYAPRPKKKGRKVLQPVHSLAFHPSGRFLAVVGQISLVEFVDTAHWRQTVAFDWKLGPLYGVAFSPDGALAATGSKKGKIVVWDVDV
jgi:WD40 repeat protein